MPVDIDFAGELDLITKILLIAVAGALGTLSRYALVGGVNRVFGVGPPMLVPARLSSATSPS